MKARWRPNNKITFSRWMDCPRCGLPWPRQVYKKQRGLDLCPECIDKKDHRQYIAEGEIKEPRGPKFGPWDPD